MTPTLEFLSAYAAKIADFIEADFREEPNRYADVSEFADLYDVCDANEYLLLADDFFRLTPDDWEAALERYDRALDLVDLAVNWPASSQELSE
jgi:hypothetical protein